MDSHNIRIPDSPERPLESSFKYQNQLPSLSEEEIKMPDAMSGKEEPNGNHHIK
jgi:hypothetical protein